MSRTKETRTAALLGFGISTMLTAANGADTLAVNAVTRVTIDQQKRTCVDGKPFFPIGLYSVSPQEKIAEVKELGFNTVHTYSGEGSHAKDDASSPEAMRAYLDTAAKLGLKVFMGLPRFQVIKGDALRLEARVKLLRDSPALLVWYLFDEPDTYAGGIAAAPVKALADMLRAQDPNHPSMLALCLLERRQEFHAGHPEYVALPDILMTDPYPRNPGNADLSLVAREIAVARKLVRDAKPIWNVVQLHGKGPGGTGFGLQEPDWTELRNMTYQSLVAGAKGITFFCYNCGEFKLFKSPAGLKNAKRIAGELGTLAPILLSDELKVSPIAVEKADGLLSRTFVHEGRTFLMVVNSKPKGPVTMTATAVGGTLPAEAKVLFEERSVKTFDGTLTEPIEANGVRVYELGGGGW